MFVDTSALTATTYYRLCMQLDALPVGDTGVAIYVSALNALPVGGLKKRVALIEAPATASADAAYPNPHTCSHELELPAYSSRAVLRARLFRALDEFGQDGSFHQE